MAFGARKSRKTAILILRILDSSVCPSNSFRIISIHLCHLSLSMGCLSQEITHIGFTVTTKNQPTSWKVNAIVSYLTKYVGTKGNSTLSKNSPSDDKIRTPPKSVASLEYLP